MSDGFDKSVVHDLASITALGLTFIRTSGADGRADLCEVEADHLHDLPVVMKSRRWDLLEHYLELQRRRYLDGLAALGRETWHDGLAWGRLAVRLAEHRRGGPSAPVPRKLPDGPESAREEQELGAGTARAGTSGDHGPTSLDPAGPDRLDAGFGASLRSELLDLLGGELLHLRALAGQGRAEQCSLEADHLHNLPMTIATECWGKLGHYNAAERPCYRHALARHGLTPRPELLPVWDTITAHLMARELDRLNEARSDP